MKKIYRITGLLSMILCQENATASTACEGVRIGIQGGYGLVNSTVKNTQSFAPHASDTSSISGHGAIGGVTIDWNTLVGHSDVFMGAELSFNFVTCKGKKSTQGVLLGGAAPGNDLATTVLFKRSYDFTGKIGYLFKQAALAYVKAGPSMAYWKASSVSNTLPASGGLSSKSVGLVIGVGAEFPLSDRISFGVEYNYRQHKDFAHVLNRTTGAPAPLLNVSIKPTSSAIMFRLNYKVSAVDFTTSAPVKERKRKRIKRPANVNP